MSGSQHQPTQPLWLGGISQLADAAEWRALGTGVGGDLPTMQRTALDLRDRFGGLDLWHAVRSLAVMAEGSHALARLVQADLEAVRLLRAAGAAAPSHLLAVFPAVSGALRASEGPDGWSLDGTQSRSVHAAAIAGAVVLAGTDDGDRLFLVDLGGSGVVHDRGPLRVIAPQDPNGPVSFSGAPVTPVGSAAWWAARRPSWDDLLYDAGCWFGSCVWLCRAVEQTLRARDDLADLLRVGRVDVWVYAARLAIRDAVVLVDAAPTSVEAELAARRAVATVVTTADTVIRLVAAISDPRVSREDGDLPSRVAQLQIALRRFDADGNLRAVGRLIADGIDGRGAD